MKKIIIGCIFLFLFQNWLCAEDYNTNLNDITLNVLDQASKVEDDSIYSPKHDHVYIAYLIEIDNNSPFDIYAKALSIFKLISTDGYVVAPNIRATGAMNSDRLRWQTDDIPSGEVRKGWIAFDITTEFIPSSITFEVEKITKPHYLENIGTIKLPL